MPSSSIVLLDFLGGLETARKAHHDFEIKHWRVNRLHDLRFSKDGFMLSLVRNSTCKHKYGLPHRPERKF